ncbi:ATP-dependent Clp protease proteolytic subunit [Puniceicoccaceae bacterium K14]|nr:ATP-dependent Clp protease proteolytic subunit [Puniceicoccaceae bacterium K14]
MPDKKEDKESESSAAPQIQKKFLEERKIFLWGEVNDESCKDVTHKLLYLEATDPGKPIYFYINTPGGSVTAGLAVYDTIKLISSEVIVIVTGLAASMGSILLSAPKKGNRLLYPHSKVLIHQPLIGGRFTGPAVDIHIFAQDMEKTRDELNRILSEASGQPMEKIVEDTDRDFYLNAQEAIEYGLADRIIDSLDGI